MYVYNFAKKNNELNFRNKILKKKTDCVRRFLNAIVNME